MKKTVLSLLFAALLFSCSKSDNLLIDTPTDNQNVVYNGNINFYSQNEINSFDARYTEVNGTIQIHNSTVNGSGETDISSLNNLKKIKKTEKVKKGLNNKALPIEKKAKKSSIKILWTRKKKAS